MGRIISYIMENKIHVWNHQADIFFVLITTGWWFQPLWKISKSVGIMKFPTEWKVIIHSCSKAPTRVLIRVLTINMPLLTTIHHGFTIDLPLIHHWFIIDSPLIHHWFTIDSPLIHHRFTIDSPSFTIVLVLITSLLLMTNPVCACHCLSPRCCLISAALLSGPHGSWWSLRPEFIIHQYPSTYALI